MTAVGRTFEADPAPTDAESGDQTVEAVDEEALFRLAQMPALEYDRVRKEEAKRLGIRSGTLDREVERLRYEIGADVHGGFLEDPVPWPAPVNGAGLLDFLAATVRKHVVTPLLAPETLALWIMHAHAHAAWTISPLLAATSPTPECGKTTLLTLIGALVPRPVAASNITAAALFRAIEKWHPTLVIDEADTFLKDSDELRGVVNSGHNRAGAFVIRTSGEDHDPQSFSTWAPKAIALIGGLPPTLDSRSIHVELRRLAAGEVVEPLRGDRLEHLEPLRRMAWTWAQDHLAELGAADPVLPEGLRGRTADNWRPLVAIADVAGGDWPVKARQAAEKLSAGRNEQSAGVMLLDDIRGLFSNRNTDRLTSAEIVDALGKREDRPWSEWRSDKPITARQLARLLEPFGVHPTTIRTHTGTAKGYHHVDFADAFLRYPGAASVTPSQAREAAALRQSASVTVVGECYGSDVSATAENGGCDGETDEPGDKSGSASDEDLQVAFQERAAILEHDGGLSRHEAEQRAAAEIGWEALLGRRLQVLAGEHAAIIEIEDCQSTKRADLRTNEAARLNQRAAEGAADG